MSAFGGLGLFAAGSRSWAIDLPVIAAMACAAGRALQVGTTIWA
jgi:hypothetical protein